MTAALALQLAASALAGEPLPGTVPGGLPATLGQPLALEITLTLDAAETAALDVPRSSTDAFKIAGVEKLSDGPPARFRVRVQPLEIGRVPVALYWSVRGPAGAREGASDVVWLEVSEPPGTAPDAEIRDIKPPLDARPALWPWLLAALVGAAAWEWRRRRRAAAAARGEAALPVDDRPCEVVAESELAALEAAGLWERGLFKEYYAALTEIVRRYLERRYEIPATRLTSAELQRHLRQAEVERAVAQRLRELLERADLVKFAKIVPEAGWGGADLAASREIVQRTRPVPPPAAAGTEAR